MKSSILFINVLRIKKSVKKNTKEKQKHEPVFKEIIQLYSLFEIYYALLRIYLLSLGILEKLHNFINLKYS